MKVILKMIKNVMFAIYYTYIEIVNMEKYLASRKNERISKIIETIRIHIFVLKI